MSQTESSAQSADAGAAPAPSDVPPAPTPQPAVAEAPKPSVVVPDDDLKSALSEIRNSWHDYNKCDRTSLCSQYFESYGVGLTFGDGTLVSFAHLQRLKASSHDCIVNARAALDKSDRALAVQWVMAARSTDPLTRNWLGDHPDAVVAALKRFSV
jgi:hypothetical protein